MNDSTSTKISMTKDQIMDLAIATCEAREAVFDQVMGYLRAQILERDAQILKLDGALDSALNYLNRHADDLVGDDCIGDGKKTASYERILALVENAYTPPPKIGEVVKRLVGALDTIVVAVNATQHECYCAILAKNALFETEAVCKELGL